MSAITKEFTKEQLQQIIETDHVQCGESSARARITLASLEAEVVGYVDAEYAELLKSGHIESCSVYAEQGEGCITLFTVPPAPVENTGLQRKAAIHDALCEKYNVESLIDFVEWQRNHIAELKAAPPAPVGHGEAAVMPDYPGYVMTQRECFQAGKKAGLTEAGNAPVIPDGLRLALSNAGIAVPESDEMLAATCEKHIQALVTWVKDRRPFQSLPAAPQQE